MATSPGAEHVDDKNKCVFITWDLSIKNDGTEECGAGPRPMEFAIFPNLDHPEAQMCVKMIEVRVRCYLRLQ